MATEAENFDRRLQAIQFDRWVYNGDRLVKNGARHVIRICVK